MEKKSEVSIVRCKKINSLVDVRAAICKSLDLIGGLESAFRRGDQIFIKPNILMPMDYKSGAVTNPFAIETLIDTLREIGIRKIIIGEGA